MLGFFLCLLFVLYYCEEKNKICFVIRLLFFYLLMKIFYIVYLKFGVIGKIGMVNLFVLFCVLGSGLWFFVC